jgi:transposase
MSPKTGYVKRGSRLYRQHIIQRSKKKVCLCAISPVLGVYSKLYDRNINGELFAQFLEDLPFKKGTNVILDNASIHKTNSVLLAAKRKDFYLQFIPPYSPDYNPIENVFGIAKNSFRKWNVASGRTLDEFVEGISRSFSQHIDTTTVQNCYSHSRKFISNTFL